MASLWDDGSAAFTGLQPPPDGGQSSLWDDFRKFFTPDQASPGSPRSAVTMPPEVGSYLQDVITGKAAMDSLRQNLGPVEGDQAAFDPAHPLGAHPTESQFERAMNLALGFSGGGLGIRAYHGSPHDFGAFDTAKIGTGEGAQVYGHGLYFAENEPVARGYRDALAAPPQPMKFMYKGEDIHGPLVNRDAIPDYIWSAPQDLHPRLSWTKPEAMTPEYFDKVKGDLERTISNYENSHAKGQMLMSGEYNTIGLEKYRLGEARAALKALNDPEFEVIPPKPSPGKMYEVNIKAEPKDFLQWDKPLSEQSQGVQKAFGRIVDRDLSQETGWAKLTGEEAYRAVVERAGIRGGGEAALREAGIPGIRYLDQGSRGAGEGTHNYVIFDPKTIEIIRKYGIAGLLGSGAAAGPTNGGS